VRGPKQGVTALVAAILIAAIAVSAAWGSTATPSRSNANLKVAVILKTFSNEYWTAMRSGAQAAAKHYGVSVSVDAAANETNTQEQVSKLQAMVAAGANCIAAAPITGTNLIQALAKPSKAGTPIVNLDSQIDAAQARAAGLKVATFIASNNKLAGVKAGRQLLSFLGSQAKGAEVAIIGGIAGDANSNARMSGFRLGIKGKGPKVVQFGTADWDRTKALNLATDILRAHPNLVGIFNANDTMALGAEQAVINAHKQGKVYVLGIDGSSDSLKSVKAGQQSASVAQSPYSMGYMGVEACMALNNGKSLPAKIDSPTFVITKKNAAKALAVYPRPVALAPDPIASLAK
jgi:ABC-type sugar transport system substrate-binding protein